MARSQVMTLEPQFTIRSLKSFFANQEDWANLAAAMRLAQLPD
jgi:hypothetical protein